MLNISTRKGLGFGAVVALATTLFSGAPAAQAAVAPVTLAGNDSYGTYTVPFGTNFDLKSFVTYNALGGYEGFCDGDCYGLKYNVENVSTNSNYVDMYVATGYNDFDHYYGPDHYELSAGNDYSYDADDYGHSYEQNDFSVSAQNYFNNTPIKLKVTAWVDTDGDYNVDPTEESASQTITWVAPESLAATTKILDTYEGEGQIEAAVTFANKDINVEQVATSMAWGWDYEGYYNEDEASVFGVEWTRNTTDETFVGYDDYDGNSPSFYYSENHWDVYYDSDLKAVIFPWTWNIDGGSDEVAKGLYTAQLWAWNDYDSANSNHEDIWSKVGTKAQATVAANVVSYVGKVSTTVGANVINWSSPSSHDYIVRSGTTSVTYSATVYNEDDEAVGAGIAGKFYVGDDNLNAGSTITSGGKTLVAGGNDISVPVTTDANGKISITITATAADGDEIYVYAVVRGEYSDDDEYDSYTEWQDTDWQIYGNPGDDRAVAVGGSTSISYRVEDQWNQPAGSDFQVVVTRTSCSNRDTNASWSYTVPVSNGAATVSIKDNGAGFGVDCVYGQLQKKLSGGGFNNYGESYGLYLYYTDASLLTVSSLTAELYDDNNGVTDSNSTVAPVMLSDLSKFVAYNENQWNTTNSFVDGNNTYNNTDTESADSTLEVSGTVSAALVDAAYVPVTISLPGAVFYTYGNADSGWNYDWMSAKDSLTTYTDANGYYYVYIYSDVPGKQTITVTSGGKSKTVDVTFAQSTPKSVALSVAGGAASAQSGRAVPVSATVNYVTGVSDTGSVDFTATAPSGSTTLTSSKVTVSFVRSSGNVTHKKAVMTAHWSNAKGQTVLVTVDGYRRYNQTELADTANFFSKKLKKGRHTINLYIGGVLIDSLKFTVK